MLYAEALMALQEIAMLHSFGEEVIPIAEAEGRIASQDVRSYLKIPTYTNSGVDGFAVRSAATKIASVDQPLNLKVLGTLYPGMTPPVGTRDDEAWEIMTGAPVPFDCDACVKVEDVQVRKNEKGMTYSVHLSAQIPEEENLRLGGSDFEIADEVLSAGDRIRSEHLMALAATGHAEVHVKVRPRILLLSTGQELAAAGTPLEPGQIYNSTQLYLLETLRKCGAEVKLGPIIPDDRQMFLQVLRQALQDPPDLIVTTGAVSMGKADFIRPCLEELHAKIIFHRVSIRPGKPILFARFAGHEKHRATAFFGLPGNPISSLIGTRFFIQPFLRSCWGQAQEKSFRAELTNAVKKPSDLRCFFKSKLQIKDGRAMVEVIAGQPSFMIRPLLHSTSWAVLPENETEIPAGSLIEVYPQEGAFLV